MKVRDGGRQENKKTSEKTFPYPVSEIISQSMAKSENKNKNNPKSGTIQMAQWLRTLRILAPALCRSQLPAIPVPGGLTPSTVIQRHFHAHENKVD